MAKFKVLKPLMDLQTGRPLQVGDVIERTVKEVELFEKSNEGYLKRVAENNKKVGE